MNTPRCGVGAAVLDGKLIAMGKCLQRLSKLNHMIILTNGAFKSKIFSRCVECHMKNGETKNCEIQYWYAGLLFFQVDMTEENVLILLKHLIYWQILGHRCRQCLLHEADSMCLRFLANCLPVEDLMDTENWSRWNATILTKNLGLRYQTWLRQDQAQVINLFHRSGTVKSNSSHHAKLF